MNILAIGAHPDDLEILCAGTLAAYSAQGHHVTMCVVTNGELGSDRLSREATEETRRWESERSAALLGAELLWLDEPDGFLFDTPQLRNKLIHAVRTARPDVLIVHSPSDYHPDHRTAGTAALNVRQLGSCALIETGQDVTSSIPAVLFMETLTGAAFEPDVWVDISSTIETKLAMLTQHRSQNDWLRSLHGIDYTDFVHRHDSMRGLQAETRYAEGFQIHRGFPVPVNIAQLLPASKQSG